MNLRTSNKLWRKKKKGSDKIKARNRRANIIRREQRLEKMGFPFYLADVTPKLLIEPQAKRRPTEYYYRHGGAEKKKAYRANKLLSLTNKEAE